MRVVEGL